MGTPYMREWGFDMVGWAIGWAERIPNKNRKSKIELETRRGKQDPKQPVGGYIEDRGDGFYRARLNERRMTYDRPHPRSEIGRGLAKRFRDFFKEAGVE